MEEIYLKPLKFKGIPDLFPDQNYDYPLFYKVSDGDLIEFPKGLKKRSFLEDEKLKTVFEIDFFGEVIHIFNVKYAFLLYSATQTRLSHPIEYFDSQSDLDAFIKGANVPCHKLKIQHLRRYMKRFIESYNEAFQKIDFYLTTSGFDDSPEGLYNFVFFIREKRKSGVSLCEPYLVFNNRISDRTVDKHGLYEGLHSYAMKEYNLRTTCKPIFPNENLSKIFISDIEDKTFNAEINKEDPFPGRSSDLEEYESKFRQSLINILLEERNTTKIFDSGKWYYSGIYNEWLTINNPAIEILKIEKNNPPLLKFISICGQILENQHEAEKEIDLEMAQSNLNLQSLARVKSVIQGVEELLLKLTNLEAFEVCFKILSRFPPEKEFESLIVIYKEVKEFWEQSYNKYKLAVDFEQTSDKKVLKNDFISNSKPSILLNPKVIPGLVTILENYFSESDKVKLHEALKGANQFSPLLFMENGKVLADVFNCLHKSKKKLIYNHPNDTIEWILRNFRKVEIKGDAKLILEFKRKTLKNQIQVDINKIERSKRPVQGLEELIQKFDPNSPVLKHK